MFDDVKTAWRLWSLYAEVKKMDKKALLKLLVTAVIAAVSVGGAGYLETETVNYAAIGTAILVALWKHMQNSPLVK